MREDRAMAAAAETSGIAPVGIAEKLGFCGYSMSSNIVYQFKSMYYLFFLTNALKVDVLLAGSILTIGMIWDAVNDPLVGFWAVNHKFRNGERVRPFALWASLPWAATVVLLFTDFGATGRLQAVIALVVYLVFELLNTCAGIPYNSMGSLATDRDSDRRAINVFRNLGGSLGAGVGAVACLPLLRAFGALDRSGNLREGEGARGFFLAAIVMGVLCVAGCLVHYFTTRERVRPIAEKEDRLKAREVAGMLLRCRSWVLNTLYVILYGVINTLTMSSIAYYATYVLGSTAAATAIQAVFLVFSIVGTLLVPPIDKALGRKKTMLLGAAIYVLGKLWFILDPTSLGAMYLNAASVGVAVAIAFVMFNTNRNNIVDIIEWRDGRRLDSMVSTADNLVSKLATAGSMQAMTIALSAAGLDAAVKAQPAAVATAINAMLGWIPAALAALMLVVVAFLDIEGDMKRMREAKAAAKPR